MATRKALTDPRKGIDPLAEAPYVKTTANPVTKSAEAVAQESEEPMVFVNVGKAFTLTDDNHVSTPYPAGAAKMPRSHAEHWFSKAHGVTIVD